MMDAVYDRLLWIGSAADLRSPREIFDNEIAAVVDVSLEESPAQLPRQLMYCRFPLNDGGGNDPRLLRMSVQTTSAQKLASRMLAMPEFLFAKSFRITYQGREV